MKSCCTCVGWKVMPFTQKDGDGICKKRNGRRTSYSFICPKYNEDKTFMKWVKGGKK